MNKERLLACLTRDEGCNLKRHLVAGIPHIGMGINLANPLPDDVLDYLGVDDEDDIEEITQEQSDWLTERAIDIATADVKAIFAECWGNLSPIRQEILVNLSFNLGGPRLQRFKNMVAAVISGDYATAAAEMLDSRAARQTGDRYKRLAGAFKNGDEKHLELSVLYDDAKLFPEQSVMGSVLKDYSDADLLAEIARRLGIKG